MLFLRVSDIAAATPQKLKVLASASALRVASTTDQAFQLDRITSRLRVETPTSYCCRWADFLWQRVRFAERDPERKRLLTEQYQHPPTQVELSPTSPEGFGWPCKVDNKPSMARHKLGWKSPVVSGSSKETLSQACNCTQVPALPAFLCMIPSPAYYKRVVNPEHLPVHLVRFRCRMGCCYVRIIESGPHSEYSGAWP